MNLRSLVGAALVVGLSACGPEERGDRRKAAAAPESAAAAPAPSAPLSHAARRERTEAGKRLYLAECSGCHGERGRGDGPAAASIDPKPRDLTKERFRYRTTAPGSAPRREDLHATIARGLPGSAMPAFEFLAPGERELLVDYVRHLAGIDREPEPEAVATGTETAAGAASVERGKHAYEKMQCGQCHGPAGRGDGPAAKGMKDEMERPIQVRDFSLGFYRRGASAAEIYRTFMAGLDGTPMPSYAASLSNDEAWDLAHYMQTFQKPKAPPPADPLAHARRVVEEKQCTGCHVIEGKGARVGPDLDVSAKKLRFEWAREWLSNPRALGKLYPFTKFRMPDLKLRPDEIEALLRLFAHVAQRPYPDPAETPAALPETDLAKGQLLYVLKCAECHNLGNVIPTPEAKRQGPDLIWANRRLRYDWIPDWVKSPSAVYPGTTMVDTNLSVEEIELIRGFLWKISRDSEKRP